MAEGQVRGTSACPAPGRGGALSGGNPPQLASGHLLPQKGAKGREAMVAAAALVQPLLRWARHAGCIQDHQQVKPQDSGEQACNLIRLV
jgi:hypothetical protein